jgi:N-acetylglutamate synthase-like GNAT family acetyltransferase
VRTASRSLEDLTFRPYRLADRAACLSIFDGNTPDFFAPSERAEYADFLSALKEPYFVLETLGEVVACGGVYAVEERAGLSWGMVARPYHRCGLGRVLLERRLKHLRTHHPHVRELWVNTSQHTQGFFRRFGFVTQEVREDAFAPGLHEYRMKRDLASPGPITSKEIGT